MDNKFVEGLFCNDKSKAPSFVDANVCVNAKFVDYYHKNCDAKGNLRFDIKTAQSGKQYAEKDNWKPQEKFIKKDGKIEVEPREIHLEAEENEIIPQNIPF